MPQSVCFHFLEGACFSNLEIYSRNSAISTQNPTAPFSWSHVMLKLGMCFVLISGWREGTIFLTFSFPYACVCLPGVDKMLLWNSTSNSTAPPLLFTVSSPFPSYLQHGNVLETSQSCLLPPARSVQLTVLFQEQKGEDTVPVVREASGLGLELHPFNGFLWSPSHHGCRCTGKR